MKSDDRRDEAPATPIASTDPNSSGVRLSGATLEPREPYALPSIDTVTGGVAGFVTGGGVADARRAVDVASDRVDDWRATAPTERAHALRAIASRLRDEADGNIPTLVSRETGKRLAESRAEMYFSAAYFEWYADLISGRCEDRWPGPTGVHVVRARPVGIAAVVTPWNFPVSIPARKIAPALAAGCPVVWKPSEVSPLASMRVAALCDEVLPPGVLSTISGDGAAIVGAWLDDARVRALSFTGSTEVGRSIAEGATRHFTRTVLELGGQAPFIVLDDADHDAAVACAVTAKYRNNGQSCIAANRIWVPAHNVERFAADFEAQSGALSLGDPQLPDTDLGPMALPTDPERLEALARDAEAHGADTRRGHPSPSPGGHFVAPIVAAEPEAGAAALEQEVFGPLAVVSGYEEIDEVISAVRALPHGLGGYICTVSPERGLALADALGLGIVGVNTATPNIVNVPFGGARESGWGYEGGQAGMDAFLALQSTACAPEVA